MNSLEIKKFASLFINRRELLTETQKFGIRMKNSNQRNGVKIIKTKQKNLIVRLHTRSGYLTRISLL